MRHQRMADVQFIDALDRGHSFNVVVVQAVTGVDDQAFAQTHRNTVDDALQLIRHFSRRGGIGITAGVQFDGGRANTAGRFDLALVGVDEQRDFAADLRQAVHCGFDPRFLAGHIQAAFGGELLAGFRHQADVGRADAFGERHHFFGHTHFEVHTGLQHVLEQQYVALLDVAAVFAQVHGDAVGARFFGVQRSLDRVRVTGAPGLAQGSDMVDVDAKKNAIAGGHGSAPE